MDKLPEEITKPKQKIKCIECARDERLLKVPQRDPVGNVVGYIYVCAQHLQLWCDGEVSWSRKKISLWTRFLNFLKS